MKDNFNKIIDFIKKNLVIVVPVAIVLIAIVASIISVILTNNNSDDTFDSYDEGMLDQIHDEYVNGNNFALDNRDYLSTYILDRNSMVVYENLSDFVLSPQELEAAPSENSPEEGQPKGYYTGTIKNVTQNTSLNLTSPAVSYNFNLYITDNRSYNVQTLLSNHNPVNDPSMIDYYGEYYVAVLLESRSEGSKRTLYINHYGSEYDHEITEWLRALNISVDDIDINYIDLFEEN